METFMNALEFHYDHHCVKPAEQIQSLNLLTEHQIISDCVLTPADVADIDAMRAVDWLRKRARIDAEKARIK